MHINNWDGRLLIFIWLIIQIILYNIIGVNTSLEAEKYIHQAKNLVSYGSYSAPKYIFYSTQVVLIACFLKIGLGYLSIVLLQILTNGAATIVFFRTVKKASNNIKVAGIATTLYICFLPLQQWNFYLYTESLFISFTILFVCLVYRFPPHNFHNLFVCCCGLFLLIITRPFGLLFLPAIFIYTIWISSGLFRKAITLLTGFSIVIFFLLVNHAFNGGEDMDVMKPFIEEHVICFIPNNLPSKLDIIRSNFPLKNLAYYIVNNPIHFFKLAGLKLFSFFKMYRPFYSIFHNVLLLLFIIPVYLLALYSFFVKSHFFKQPLHLFIVITLLVYSLGCTFQCDDYHSRFTMPILPLIFIYCSIGIVHLCKSSNIPVNKSR